MESIVGQGDIWKAGINQASIGFGVRQFVRDVREPRPARLKLAH
jgi:hypothetical protein